MTSRNFCSSCGSALDAKSVFCASCGNRVPEGVPQTSPKLNRPLRETATPAYGGTIFDKNPTSSHEMFSTTFIEEEKSQQSWYERTWVATAALLLCWIIGLIFLYLNTSLARGQKVALAVFTFLANLTLWTLVLTASPHNASLSPNQGRQSDINLARIQEQLAAREAQEAERAEREKQVALATAVAAKAFEIQQQG